MLEISFCKQAFPFASAAKWSKISKWKYWKQVKSSDTARGIYLFPVFNFIYYLVSVFGNHQIVSVLLGGKAWCLIWCLKIGVVPCSEELQIESWHNFVYSRKSYKMCFCNVTYRCIFVVWLHNILRLCFRINLILWCQNFQVSHTELPKGSL